MTFSHLNFKQKPADDEELPDLNDPEVNKAATKIQAHFKGHLVRKNLKDPKDADASDEWILHKNQPENKMSKKQYQTIYALHN